jgi:tetratricopeptide (TPR) repeat protein
MGAETWLPCGPRGAVAAHQETNMPTARESSANVQEALGAAAACVTRGDFEAALSQLKALLALDPRHELATGMLAGLYAELKMPDRARHYYEQVLRLNPANALARFQLGLLQFESGQPQEALETWQPAVANTEDYLTHFHCALALLELERRDEARRLLERAGQYMPRDHLLYPQLELLRHPLDS